MGHELDGDVFLIEAGLEFATHSFFGADGAPHADNAASVSALIERIERNAA